MGNGPWPAGTLLNRLPERIGTELLRLGTARRVAADTELVSQGSEDRSVYLLIDGMVKVSAMAENGVDYLLGIRVSGDVVGEMAVITDQPRAATVTTCAEAVVAVIKGEVFHAFAGRNPALGLTLVRMTEDRLRWANEIRLNASAYDVGVCLARALLALADQHGRPVKDGVDIGVPLTQAELGSLIGASTVAVQRALREMHRHGMLTRGRRTVTITDRARLSEYAQSAA